LPSGLAPLQHTTTITHEMSRRNLAGPPDIGAGEPAWRHRREGGCLKNMRRNNKDTENWLSIIIRLRAHPSPGRLDERKGLPGVHRPLGEPEGITCFDEMRNRIDVNIEHLHDVLDGGLRYFHTERCEGRQDY
jgi:hypothetical protein